jgi:hypothetical protein
VSSAQAAVSARHCNVRLDGIPCPDAPEYLVVFDDCEPCRLFGGVLFCRGHNACLQHTAMLRTNGYRFIDTPAAAGDVVSMSADATPVRVRTLAGASRG